MIFPGLSEHTNLHYYLTDFMNRSGPTLINAMPTLFLEHTIVFLPKFASDDRLT